MPTNLPPLRPLHSALLIVLTIGFFGASLTSLLAGSWSLSAAWLTLAVGAAILVGRAVARIRRDL